MRVILVVLHEHLKTALISILKSDIEYAAIIVDEVQPAQKFLAKLNYPQNSIYPMYEIRECLENLYYDFVILVSDPRVTDILSEKLAKFGLPKNKLVNVRMAIKNHSSAIFINGWTLNNNFNDEDFFDIDHINPQGAAKFSAILNDVIKNLEK